MCTRKRNAVRLRSDCCRWPSISFAVMGRTVQEPIHFVSWMLSRSAESAAWCNELFLGLFKGSIEIHHTAVLCLAMCCSQVRKQNAADFMKKKKPQKKPTINVPLLSANLLGGHSSLCMTGEEKGGGAGGGWGERDRKDNNNSPGTVCEVETSLQP